MVLIWREVRTEYHTQDVCTSKEQVQNETIIDCTGSVVVAVCFARTNPELTAPVQTVSQGPHYRTVSQIAPVRTNHNGRIFYKTNAYTELAVGMHRPNQSGALVDANPQIEIQQAGGAIASQARHSVYFPGELCSDAIQVVTPDGKTLTSRPVGLAYSDGIQSVFIAELRTNITGQLLASDNEVLYSNICDSETCRLDLLCRNKLSGFESDLIIRTRLPEPQDFGFTNSATMKLQWWTEFFNPPTPAKTSTALPNGSVNEVLDFGELKMQLGKGFFIGLPSPGAQVIISKQWVTIEGRTFLVEELPQSMIAARLSHLEEYHAQLDINSGGALGNN